MSDDDTLLLLRRKPRDGLSRVHSQLRRSLRAAGGDAVITPREIKADKACPYIRSTAEGTHHCALATAPDDKLREAARMALEALGQDNPAGRTATIAALREALEGER